MREVNWEDMAFAGLISLASWEILVKPLFREWAERRHTWVTCHTFEEAERVVGRVRDYMEMEPKLRVIWPHIGTPYYCVRVPKSMLTETRFDDSINKLKEPINV